MYVLCRSSDGRILVVSSTDGYCSLVSFAKGELGTPYVGEKNRDSEKHESIMRDSSKDAEHESADVEMEDVSRKPSSAVLEQAEKCENKSCGSNLPPEVSRKQGENKSPSRKAPEESCSKQEEESVKPSSNPTVEPSKKQDKDGEHNRLSPGTTEDTPQEQQEESTKSSPGRAQEPPVKQITVRRARDRCALVHIVCVCHLKSKSLP